MFRLVVVLSVLYLVCASLEDSEYRVVNGRQADILEFPYQVSIQENSIHFCGGSILNEQWILTAAHCIAPVIQRNAVSALACRAGSSTWLAEGVLKAVEQAYFHENYNSANKDYDIAILKIQGQFIYSASIKPVRLLAPSPISGSSVVVSGWGQTSELNTNSPTNLNKLMMKYLTTQDCSKYHPGVTDRMVCAIGPVQDSCYGDSGGPLCIEGTNLLVGIVSWGIRCATAGLPGVYVNLLNFEMRSYIERFIGKINY